MRADAEGERQELWEQGKGAIFFIICISYYILLHLFPAYRHHPYHGIGVGRKWNFYIGIPNIRMGGMKKIIKKYGKEKGG